MAQSDNPYGFWPVNRNAEVYYLPEKASASFKMGDALYVSSGVDCAATGAAIIGVAAMDSTGTTGAAVAYWPANKNDFYIRISASAASLYGGDEIDLTGTTGIMQADPGTSTKDDLRFLGFPFPNEDKTAAGARIIVSFNNSLASPDGNAAT